MEYSHSKEEVLSKQNSLGQTRYVIVIAAKWASEIKIKITQWPIVQVKSKAETLFTAKNVLTDLNTSDHNEDPIYTQYTVLGLPWELVCTWSTITLPVYNVVVGQRR